MQKHNTKKGNEGRKEGRGAREIAKKGQRPPQLARVTDWLATQGRIRRKGAGRPAGLGTPETAGEARPRLANRVLAAPQG